MSALALPKVRTGIVEEFREARKIHKEREARERSERSAVVSDGEFVPVPAYLQSSMEVRTCLDHITYNMPEVMRMSARGPVIHVDEDTDMGKLNELHDKWRAVNGSWRAPTEGWR